MILIVTNGKCFGLYLYEYLKKNKISVLKIELESLINSSIKHNFSSDESSWIEHEKSKITMDKFTGVYHSINVLDEKLFLDFNPDDSEYAREEWYAYIMYWINKFPKIINRIPYEQLGGSFLSLPYNFELAKKVGLSIPEYEISSKGFAKEKINYGEYLLYPSIYNPYYMLDSHDAIENSNVIVKKSFGWPVITHIIGDDVEATVVLDQKKQSIILPDKIRSSCLQMSKHLNMAVIEILFFTQNNKDFTFYNAVSYPSWEMSHLSLDETCKKIHMYLM